MKINLCRLSFLLISLCLGGTLSAQQYYVSGISAVGAGMVGEYYLEGYPALPSGTVITWTAVNGQIVGQSSAPDLTMCYVYWPAGLTSGSINATVPTGGISVTLFVHPSSLTDQNGDASAVPATRGNPAPDAKWVEQPGCTYNARTGDRLNDDDRMVSGQIKSINNR